MADLAKHRPHAVARRGANSKGPVAEFLAFVLAGEVYAVPIREVHEILRLPPVTEVPRAPREVLGVVSVRGMLVTVIDLRRRLSLPETELTKKGRILLVRSSSDELVGLYVDEVLQVFRLAESDIEVASGVLGGTLADYVIGIGRQGQMLLVLIDVKPIVGGLR
jgi:purine-binding chemotaxis protein CheW